MRTLVIGLVLAAILILPISVYAVSVPDPPRLTNSTINSSPPYTNTVSSSEPEGNGAAISHYNFLRANDGLVFTSLVNQTGSTYVDTSPINNATAKYRIFANNTAGWSFDYSFPLTLSIMDDMVLMLPFGNSTNDSGIHDNDGNVMGTEQYDTTSHNGYSFDFDGSTYVMIPNETDYDFGRNSPLTISFWIEHLPQNNINILSKRNSNSAVGYSVWLQTNFINFDMDSTNQEMRVRAATTSINDGTPHHVLITKADNSTASSVQMWFDGVEQTMSVQADTLTSESIQNNIDLVVGAESDGGQAFTGSLDEFMILDRDVNESQVLQIFHERVNQADQPVASVPKITDFNIVGDVIKINQTTTISEGFPDPTVTQKTLQRSGGVVKTNDTQQTITSFPTNINDTWWYQMTDPLASYVLRNSVIVSTPHHTVHQNGSATTSVSQEYDPTYFPAITSGQGNVNYTLSRSVDQDTVTVKANRDQGGNTFNMECFVQTLAQEQLGNDTGTWYNQTTTGYYTQDITGVQNTHIYGDCFNDDLLFSFTSYTNSSLAFLGIDAFDDIYGSFLSVPVGVFFVVVMAGMATQRTAPTWIIVILAVIGVMVTIGFFELEESIWSLALIMGALGILVGRKFI